RLRRRLFGPEGATLHALLRPFPVHAVAGSGAMRVAVVGSGYVGLVSGACFSDFGHVVTCIDTDAAKVARLKEGGIPIFEPGLDVIVRRNHDADRLFFTTEFG